MRTRKIVLTALILAACPLVIAQTDTAEQRLELGEVRKVRERAVVDAALGEELRTRVVALYDDAIASLEQASGDERQAVDFDRERGGIGRMVEALEAELSRPMREPDSPLPDDASVDQADARLSRERARLSAHRSALRNAERLAEERADARNEISRRLGELDQQIELLDDEMRTARQRDAHAELKEAVRTSLVARRQAARSKIKRLRAELALLEERGTLIPWQVDQAQRRVDHSERVVARLVQITRTLRRQATEAALERLRGRCGEAAALSPALEPLAAEIERMAEQLWGTDGVIAHSEATAQTLGDTRKLLAEFRRIVQLMRRKFEAYGYRGSLERWWPKFPEDFPRPDKLRASVERLRKTVPAVQFELIRLEQQRASVRKFGETLLAELNVDERAAADVQRAARGLVDSGREILDALIQNHERYESQLVELEGVTSTLYDESEQVQAFLFEQLLWVRSVPRPVVPRISDVAEGIGWMVSKDNWSAAVDTAARNIRSRPVASGLLIGSLVLLIAARGRLRARLNRLGDLAATRFSATIEAMIHTLLLAAPLPLLLHSLSLALTQSGTVPFVSSAARALAIIASAAALLELTRQVVKPRGLAAAHFEWPLQITRTLHRGLFWREIVFLVLLQIAVQLVMAGVRPTSAAELQTYNNSLGRLTFIIAMVALGLSLLGLFRPRRDVIDKARDAHVVGKRPFYVYAYPVIVISTLLPAVLAMFGYYVSGILLAYQMTRTLWIVLAALVLGGLLLRWRTVRRERTYVGVAPEQAAAAETQVLKLLRFAIVVTAALGLFTIWTQALPALEILKRVQIWPTVAVLEPTKDEGLALAPVESAGSEETATEGDTTSKPALPLPAVKTSSGDSEVQAAAGPAPSSLTVWRLFEAILAGVIAVVLAKNLPGLLELLLRRRTRLDAGARIAFGTLTRYLIVIIGVTVSFGLLGISWSKVQWLVAALTFGLGFGLQEIVANFVSGLILLTERPVRVGDAVTMGNLQGEVSRIQIRATTITLWDRSEMIVPNKEFITGKLVNWTLSDSRRRISVPLRVVYGTDLEKVKQTLVRVAKQHPSVLEEPAPHVLLMNFGKDSIEFELRFYVEFGQGLTTKDEVQMAVDQAFRDEGIQFAIPQLSLQLMRRKGER